MNFFKTWSKVYRESIICVVRNLCINLAFYIISIMGKILVGGLVEFM